MRQKYLVSYMAIAYDGEILILMLIGVLLSADSTDLLPIFVAGVGLTLFG